MFNLLYYVTMRKHDDIRQHQLASLYHKGDLLQI